MTSNLQIFNSSDFGQIRTKLIDGEPWFCLRDICKALEIVNVVNVKNRLTLKGVRIMYTLTPGGKQELTFINEANLYKTIFQSRKESAERFTDWVTSEVLPTLRKTGSYQMTGTGPKTTSIGDVINLIRITRETMKDQGSDPKDIAQTVKGLCDQFNIQLPDCFVKPEETKLSDVLDMVDYIYQSGHTRKPTYNDYIIHLTVSRLEDKG